MTKLSWVRKSRSSKNPSSIWKNESPMLSVTKDAGVYVSMASLSNQTKLWGRKLLKFAALLLLSLARKVLKSLTLLTGKPQSGRIRAIIILFALRSVRDAIWKNAKNSEFLKQHKLRFVEDLTKEEKDRRSLLWPHVKKAREDNRKAYYVGSKAFIEGIEIKLNTEGQKINWKIRRLGWSADPSDAWPHTHDMFLLCSNLTKLLCS